METWLGQVYLYLSVELYVPVRSVHMCACHSLPPFTVRLGVCIARLRRVRQMVDSSEVCRSNLDAQLPADFVNQFGVLSGKDLL